MSTRYGGDARLGNAAEEQNDDRDDDDEPDGPGGGVDFGGISGGSPPSDAPGAGESDDDDDSSGSDTPSGGSSPPPREGGDARLKNEADSGDSGGSPGGSSPPPSDVGGPDSSDDSGEGSPPSSEQPPREGGDTRLENEAERQRDNGGTEQYVSGPSSPERDLQTVDGPGAARQGGDARLENAADRQPLTTPRGRRQGVEADQNSQWNEQAQEVEQDTLDRYPMLDEEDVSIEEDQREGGTYLTPELTESGRRELSGTDAPQGGDFRLALEARENRFDQTPQGGDARLIEDARGFDDTRASEGGDFRLDEAADRQSGSQQAVNSDPTKWEYASQGGDFRLDEAQDRQSGSQQSVNDDPTVTTYDPSGGDFHLAEAADTQGDDGQSVNINPTAVGGEQFGDVRINNPVTGNRLETDLENAEDAWNEMFQESAARAGPVGAPSVLTGQVPGQTPVEPRAEGAQGQFVETLGEVFNPPALALEGKEYAEFALTQPDRILTPVGTGGAASADELDAQAEFADDVEQRSTRIASSIQTRATENPTEFGIGAGTGIAAGAAIGTGTSLLARSASGGRVDLGSDLSGRALKRAGSGARRVGERTARALPDTDATTRVGAAVDNARRTADEGTPTVSVEFDPDAGPIDVTPEARQQIRETATAPASAARDVAERIADADPEEFIERARESARQTADEGRETVQTGFDQVTEAAEGAVQRTPDVSGDVALQQSFIRGSTLPFPDADSFRLRGGLRETAGRFGDRFDSATEWGVRQTPDVSGDVALQQSFIRESDLPYSSPEVSPRRAAGSAAENAREQLTEVSEGITSRALSANARTPDVSGDVALQQSFIRGSADPYPSANDVRTAARDQVSQAADRFGDAAEWGTGWTPDVERGDFGFEFPYSTEEVSPTWPDVTGRARREATSARFQLAEYRERAARLSDVTDYTIRVGDRGRGDVGGMADEPPIRSQIDDPFDLGEDAADDLPGAGTGRRSDQEDDIAVESDAGGGQVALSRQRIGDTRRTDAYDRGRRERDRWGDFDAGVLGGIGGVLESEREGVGMMPEIEPAPTPFEEAESTGRVAGGLDAAAFETGAVFGPEIGARTDVETRTDLWTDTRTNTGARVGTSTRVGTRTDTQQDIESAVRQDTTNRNDTDFFDQGNRADEFDVTGGFGATEFENPIASPAEFLF